MNSRLLSIFLVCLMGMASWAPRALAEGNCPPGYFPIGGGTGGWEGCAPMGPMPAPQNNSNQQSSPTSTMKRHWASRWGAIATTNGAFGYSVEMRSEESAKSLALADCESKSQGSPCRIMLVYQDQCAALVWGDEGNVASYSPTAAEAEQRALSACERRNLKRCEVYYSACSFPDLE
jgi:hypothetical protein